MSAAAPALVPDRQVLRGIPLPGTPARPEIPVLLGIQDLPDIPVRRALQVLLVPLETHRPDLPETRLPGPVSEKIP